jgi:N-methylhydantoinase B
VPGEEEKQVGKGPNVNMGPGDVSEYWWGGCSGYGDPITREPSQVAQDVRKNKVTQEYAESAYGVILDQEGDVKTEQTAKSRESIREQRLENATTVDELIDEEVS